MHLRPQPITFLLRAVGTVVALLVAAAVPTQSTPRPTIWQPKQPPLPTRWTEQVGPHNALPEYPRPRMTRPRWQNLNGLWEYSNSTSDSSPEKILVPYPPESALSGIQRHDDHMVYRRTFEVPPDWSGQRLLLHFGAVDQKARVSVNGQEVAVHEGGYTGFSADVTDALRPNGPQELRVTVQDRNESSPYPVGKQRDKPHGILYTGASGIWQTVWMEPVPEQHISRVDITPDLDTSSFAVTARTGDPRHSVEVVVSEPGGREVARRTGKAESALRLPIANPRLWSPDDPYLYDIKVRLVDAANQPIDEIGSYAGMRSVGLVKDAEGRPRIALNGRILFQQGLLDQGYWPDGIYTAPTDEALRFDLEQANRLGFNMVRKHSKIEPARWYYWADRLGLLVWQDMPSLSADLSQSPGPQPPPSEEAQAHYRDDLMSMIDQLRNVTSIVAWVPFNEGWGEFDTARIAQQVREADPTRLVDASSGVNCCYSRPDTGAGDIYDDHTYVGPGTPPVSDSRASADGEYGGLGLAEKGHLWPGEPQAYEMTADRDELTRRYTDLSRDLANIVRSHGLSAAVYTQITDVENEVNGLLTYDREVMKPDVSTIREHNQAVIDAGTP